MMLSSIKPYFYVRPSKVPGKRGIFYVRVKVNGRQLPVSVKALEMFPDEFDSKTQMPTEKCTLYFETLDFMLRIRKEISRVLSEYEEQEHIFTTRDLEHAVVEVFSRVGKKKQDGPLPKTYLEVFEGFIKDQEHLVGKTISSGTYKLRKRYMTCVGLSLKELGHYKKPIRNFTANDISSIQTYLLRSYEPGYVGRLMNVVSMVFTYAQEKDEVKDNPCKKVKGIKIDKAPNMVWLEEEELERLRNLDLFGEINDYRNAFVFCCYTGLSIGDYMLLNSKTRDYQIRMAESPKDIQPAELVQMRSGLFLIGKRRKTGTLYRVPMQQPALDIIEAYGGIEKLPFNLPRMGTMLNTLMVMSGIRKKIRFHTARKTMANLLLNVKMINPIYAVEIMGWRKIEEAKAYIVVNSDALAKQMQLA
ncbi:site-specific integrase [Rhabdobacter roseus]|uniref:Site-specific recombinase XerD n=1 Tax=Rhabdobacter roseus TaxID=1655419 RepID=A0A840TPA8_9BACT|nr:hypothetical protein [Rhabdobacter roseus]MBB5283577.1 site-specific recombinase XerD [Rhabdobacter roseus]